MYTTITDLMDERQHALIIESGEYFNQSKEGSIDPCRKQVLEVSRTDVVVVDPTPDLLYTKRKSESSSKHMADCEQSKNGETAHAESINQPTSGWQKVIPPGISFNDIYINDYVLNSGKRAFKMDSDQPGKKTCIRPETKRYRFFTEKYLHDIWCVTDNEHIYFKSKCLPSQRKNDQPHQIWCAIKMTNFNVDIGQYICVAGKSWYCNHLMALLYQISHFSKSATIIIPDDLSKTSMPMTWQKPRIEGVAAEPIMEVAVHTKYTNREFTSKLYEARAPAAVNNDSDLLTSIQETFATENARHGILMARNHVKDTVICRTHLGT
ncbi:hypothetical protein LSH36_174g04044 [Paralvinella palmiformis]|uniref:Uncharacterized protein n=1 Tax=Paralvinella palmiformis TaxID=53620 RepID=A0AAD9JSL6_9ANNE|nr:hypothetical protein LSH36_174g04044 [Paralvinella palmiformis]